MVVGSQARESGIDSPAVGDLKPLLSPLDRVWLQKLRKHDRHPKRIQWTTAPARFSKLGDLLICVRGSSTGRTNYSDDTYAIGRGVAAIRARGPNDTQYVSHQVISEVNGIVARATGSTFPSVDGESFRNIIVPLPPPAEQRAIAKTLSDVDSLLDALEELIAKKRAIKKTAMQQLLPGTTRLPGFDRNWEIKRIDEIASIDPENLPSNTPPDYTFNYISLEQVDLGKLVGYSEIEFRAAPSRARRILRRGDVLMSTVRPNLKAHLLYDEQIPNAVCSTGFAVLRAKPGLSIPSFIFAHLFGPILSSQIAKLLVGSNYPAINSQDVGTLQLPCPPDIKEQCAIADVLSDIDGEIVALEQRRKKTKDIKQGIMQELLTGRVRLLQPTSTAEAQ